MKVKTFRLKLDVDDSGEPVEVFCLLRFIYCNLDLLIVCDGRERQLNSSTPIITIQIQGDRLKEMPKELNELCRQMMLRFLDSQPESWH